MKTTHTTRLVLALCGVGALLSAAGCRGDREDQPPHLFFPDLHDQPKWLPQEKSEFFEDGRTMRQPGAGTVPFGRLDFLADPSKDAWAAGYMQDREDFLKDNKALFLGLKDDG